MSYVLSETQRQQAQELSRRDMIRERDMTDYAKALGYNPLEIATASLATKGRFKWFDMCCGDFCAGQELSHATRGKAEAVGIDLDTLLSEDRQVARNAVIRNGDVIDYPLPRDIDLITCVRGLYYVESIHRGGANKALAHWYNALPAGSRLSAEIAAEMPRSASTIQALGQALTGHTIGKWASAKIFLVDIQKTSQHPATIKL